MLNNRVLQQSPLLLIDFGSQYTPLIARRLRELGVHCAVHPYNIAEETIRKLNPCGVILSGGPETVTEKYTPRAPQIVFELECPILGICYGMQILTEQLGGKVMAGAQREFGYAQVEIQGQSSLFDALEVETKNGKKVLDVWMSHGDHVETLPSGFVGIASTATTPFAGMADEKRKYYGLQFHPEVVDTPKGVQILDRFAREICGADSVFVATSHGHQQLIQSIRTTVGTDTVILGLSGGVDSSVAAALLNEAIGKQLICIFVDTGLLRGQDEYFVIDVLRKQLNVNIITVDAQKRFLAALKGVTEPEQKRQIIGHMFVEVFDEQAASFKNAKWLAQGTIASDVIESAEHDAGEGMSKAAHIIKSHHNVAGLPENMKLQLLEPLRTLFKDEVLQLGHELGLPPEVLRRHPFPGPGLAVRILGEIKQEYIDILRKADAIFMEELHRHGWYLRVNQAFAVFLPVKSVGVIGDARQYAYVIALRAVETKDFMTARWAHLPLELLEILSTRIINEVHDVSRVVYDISGKPPATVEWE